MFGFVRADGTTSTRAHDEPEQPVPKKSKTGDELIEVSDGDDKEEDDKEDEDEVVVLPGTAASAPGAPPCASAFTGMTDCFGHPVALHSFCAFFTRKHMCPAVVVAAFPAAQAVNIVPIREQRPGVWAKSRSARRVPVAQIVIVVLDGVDRLVL